ncbi:MAG: hypothetical protein H0U73_09925 [Tatlockia sp.]|nr:hypothetical protein [Tatlockia sp.]
MINVHNINDLLEEDKLSKAKKLVREIMEDLPLFDGEVPGQQITMAGDLAKAISALKGKFKPEDQIECSFKSTDDIVYKTQAAILEFIQNQQAELISLFTNLKQINQIDLADQVNDLRQCIFSVSGSLSQQLENSAEVSGKSSLQKSSIIEPKKEIKVESKDHSNSKGVLPVMLANNPGKCLMYPVIPSNSSIVVCIEFPCIKTKNSWMEALQKTAEQLHLDISSLVTNNLTSNTKLYINSGRNENDLGVKYAAENKDHDIPAELSIYLGALEFCQFFVNTLGIKDNLTKIYYQMQLVFSTEAFDLNDIKPLDLTYNQDLIDSINMKQVSQEKCFMM